MSSKQQLAGNVRMSEAKELVLLNQASKALAEAKTLEEFKDIRDKAEAVRHYIKSAALGLNMQNQATELKLRAERKAGGCLAELDLRGGDRKSNSHAASLKLADLNIKHNQSARWQREAAVPEPAFEHYLRETVAAGKELSSAGLVRLGIRVGRLVPTEENDGGIDFAGPEGTRRANRREILSGKHVDADARFRRDHCNGDLPEEALRDLRDHFNLLASMLKPVCAGRAAELCSAEREHISRLLAEIALLLADLAARPSMHSSAGAAKSST